MGQDSNRKLNMKMQVRHPHQFITVSTDQLVFKLMVFKKELKKMRTSLLLFFRIKCLIIQLSENCVHYIFKGTKFVMIV